MIKYVLFVDDVRDITDTDAAYHFNDSCVVVCRSSKQALDIVTALGPPEFMALDHDLGGDDTIMRFLRGYQAIRPARPPPYECHSMNPAGKANVIAFMKSWSEGNNE